MCEVSDGDEANNKRNHLQIHFELLYTIFIDNECIKFRYIHTHTYTVDVSFVIFLSTICTIKNNGTYGYEMCVINLKLKFVIRKLEEFFPFILAVFSYPACDNRDTYKTSGFSA